jgi:signal transduction histidine kinase
MHFHSRFGNQSWRGSTIGVGTSVAEDGRWPGRTRGNTDAYLRSILHHQSSGSRHGLGFGDCDGLCTAARRHAPLAVVGSAKHRMELGALLAAGDVDFVIGSESSLAVAVGLVEPRLRQRHLHSTREAASRQEQENHIGIPQETRDFHEVLRHELNNPLTGILGNAELLLAELRRHNSELSQWTVLRLETIATLAVRMRETVRRLSEDWETQADRASE